MTIGLFETIETDKDLWHCWVGPQRGLSLKKFLKGQQYHKQLSKRSKFSPLTFTPFLSDQLRSRCERLVINSCYLPSYEKGQGLVATQEGQRCQEVIRNRVVPAPYDISRCWYDHRTRRARFIKQLPTVSRRVRSPPSHEVQRSRSVRLIRHNSWYWYYINKMYMRGRPLLVTYPINL